MNSFLPNIRWLCLPSEQAGLDWTLKEQEIDTILSSEGMDLAEEATYFLFSENPEDVLDGQGQCLIARPVIGPKKTFKAPFKLIDWTASPVWRETVTGETLHDLLESSMVVRQRASLDLARPFFLCVRRQLNPDLKLIVEAIFHQ
jgi:hypothetical protein